jgi:hypothetical protein
MQLRRTAAGVVLGVAALAGCGSSGARSAPDTPALDTTTTSPVTTTPAPTTTTVVPTTLPATTTTTAVADATTADAQVLARQLQSVLDRYQELYVASRTDPNRPFTDAQLIADFQEIATNEYIGIELVPVWSGFREDGSSARVGPSGTPHYVATEIVATGADSARVTYCVFDDGVTFDQPSGRAINDSAEIVHDSVDLRFDEGRWRLAKTAHVNSETAKPGVANPCLAEALVHE